MWSKVLYGDQPAGWHIAGTKESVSGISRQQLQNYMKTQYNASNTLVCVAGKLSGQSQNKVKKYFSGPETRKKIKKVPVLEKQKKPQILLHSRKTDQTHFCLGVRAYDVFNPKRYAQEILGLILGGMMSSRLFIKIREELGLAYYVKTEVSSDPDTGFLVTQVGVDNKRAEEAILAIIKEYKRISQEKVPQKEIKKAKEHLIGKMALLLEASDAQASFYGLQEILEKKILTPKEICDKINKVKAEDLSMVAKDIFKAEKLNLALIGPFKDKNKFQKLLKI